MSRLHVCATLSLRRVCLVDKPNALEYSGIAFLIDLIGILGIGLSSVLGVVVCSLGVGTTTIAIVHFNAKSPEFRPDLLYIRDKLSTQSLLKSIVSISNPIALQCLANS